MQVVRPLGTLGTSPCFRNGVLSGDGQETVIVARTRAELASGLETVRGRGSVGLVPTMGSLHEGHLSLVDAARAAAEATVVSIFVNPLQFGPAEDFASYPRDEARDVDLLRERGADLVFVPSVEEMYPEGEPVVTVDPGPLAETLCGPFRPGHFRGVLTVVARLFGLVRPDLAVFGRKDFQQSVLIRRMVGDLEMGIEVRTAPIVREADGLALSSRNRYLSEVERAQAPVIHGALARIREMAAAGERSASVLLSKVHEMIESKSLMDIQYTQIVEPDSLRPVDRVESGAVAAVAAFCGGTRLIDNTVLE